MKDWTQGVQYGIAEMATIRDKHNKMILQIDDFLKVANEVGFVDLVLPQLEKVKERLQSDILELNLQIEKQKQ